MKKDGFLETKNWLIKLIQVGGITLDSIWSAGTMTGILIDVKGGLGILSAFPIFWASCWDRLMRRMRKGLPPECTKPLLLHRSSQWA